MASVAANLNDVQLNINVVPTLQAGDVNVLLGS